MIKNVWYNSEDIKAGQNLLSDDGNFCSEEEFIMKEMTSAQVEEFKDIITSLQEGGSRCIRVFRDAVIVEDKVYNICLSCGDIVVDNKFFFMVAGKNRLKELKNEILKTKE